MDNKSLYANTVEASQFLTRLVNIPVVHSAIAVASDYYGKAKVSHSRHFPYPSPHPNRHHHPNLIKFRLELELFRKLELIRRE